MINSLECIKKEIINEFQNIMKVKEFRKSQKNVNTREHLGYIKVNKLHKYR